MTVDTAIARDASAPPEAASLPSAARAILIVLASLAMTACGLQPEKRIDDPACQYCYRLPSGVTYKTYEYYAP